MSAKDAFILISPSQYHLSVPIPTPSPVRSEGLGPDNSASLVGSICLCHSVYMCMLKIPDNRPSVKQSKG